MYKIVGKAELATRVTSLVIRAPRIANRAVPGQFVVLRLSETGERIPMSIADYDPTEGTVTMVVQRLGKTTTLLAALGVGDEVLDVLGPLGTPYPISRLGRVVCVSGGVGAAPMLSKAKALKAAGNEVVTILGAQSADLLVYERELSAHSSEVFITTADGSRGEAGLVTDALVRYLASGKKVDEVIAIGPIGMMEAVCRLTKPYEIPTVVSLNTAMVDGTGMCGGCRVTVGGKVKFTCVDGPAFDGHQVDFAELSVRQRFYHDFERQSNESHECKLDLGGVL